MEWVVNTRPRLLYPWERPVTHSIGGWVGLRADLDGCVKSHPHQDSIPEPSSLLGSLIFQDIAACPTVFVAQHFEIV
jgi:hypothetical protein